jgi:hypothetical protein
MVIDTHFDLGIYLLSIYYLSSLKGDPSFAKCGVKEEWVGPVCLTYVVKVLLFKDRRLYLNPATIYNFNRSNT